MRRLLAALALATVLAMTACLMTGTARTADASVTRTVTAWLSSYDYWSNSPPGYGIEYARGYGYPAVHDWACCRAGGTYADPVTFASSGGELAPGTRIYIPLLRRYFIKEDLCSTCYKLPAWQFDLWVGGVSRTQDADTSPGDIVNLWRQAQVIISPPRGEPVASGLLRDVRLPAPAARPARPARAVLTAAVSPARAAPGPAALDWAEAHAAGCWYSWGGTSCARGYDCSGLVMTSFQHAGIWLPRTTYGMLSSWHLVRIPLSQARRGDLLFYGSGHVELATIWWHQSFGAHATGQRVGWIRWGGRWQPTMAFRVR